MQAQPSAPTSGEQVIPTLQFSVMCEAVAQDPSRKLLLAGVFDNLLRPFTMPQFFIVNKWTNGIGKFRQTIEILKPDLTPNSELSHTDFTLTSRALGHTNVAGYINYTFPEVGVYWIQIKLDGDLILAYPCPVLNPAEVSQG